MEGARGAALARGMTRMQHRACAAWKPASGRAARATTDSNTAPPRTHGNSQENTETPVPPSPPTRKQATIAPRSSRRARATGLSRGKVDHGEDPLDAVIREIAEDTGCDAVVERLPGVDSRIIPAAERRLPGLLPHHNADIFYRFCRARITGGQLRPETNGAIAESAWTPIPGVAHLHRSSLVDVGLALAQSVPVGGLIQH